MMQFGAAAKVTAEVHALHRDYRMPELNQRAILDLHFPQNRWMTVAYMGIVFLLPVGLVPADPLISLDHAKIPVTAMHLEMLCEADLREE